MNTDLGREGPSWLMKKCKIFHLIVARLNIKTACNLCFWWGFSAYGWISFSPLWGCEFMVRKWVRTSSKPVAQSLAPSDITTARWQPSYWNIYIFYFLYIYIFHICLSFRTVSGGGHFVFLMWLSLWSLCSNVPSLRGSWSWSSFLLPTLSQPLYLKLV